MPFEGVEGRRILCLDGTEGMEGRGLMLLSVCHLAAGHFRDWVLRVIDVSDVDVELAAEALAFDTGLEVQVVRRSEASDPLAGARLYAALAHRSAAHLRLEAAAAAAIPVLAAVQAAHPSNPPGLLPPVFGHDTRAFADLLIAGLGRIEAGQAIDALLPPAMIPAVA